MVRRDCFGFDARCGARKTDRCTALTKLYCATEECKFYKTKEEYERQERREKMKIEKAKQILERCANESARLLIKNANNGDRQMAAAGFRLATALSMASLAMERQIPKAPVHRTPTSYWDDEVYECPICQNLVGMDNLRINYCDTCGQALEWNFSEEEDE